MEICIRFSLNGRKIWKYETGTKRQSIKFWDHLTVYTQFRLLHAASLRETFIHGLQADPLLVLYVKCAPTWRESSLQSPKHKILSTIVDHCERNTQREILSLWSEVLARVKIHDLSSVLSFVVFKASVNVPLGKMTAYSRQVEIYG